MYAEIRTQVWDFSKTSLVVAGVPIIDYAPDTGVTTSDNSDKYSQTVSLTKGTVVYNQLNDGTGFFTINILANSPTHHLLYAQYMERLDSQETFDSTFLNTNKNSLSENYKGCMFKTMPSADKAREVGTVAIEVFYADRVDFKDGVPV